MCQPCVKYSRHCLYEKHSRTPLTRKHLTEVEEELSLLKELVSAQFSEGEVAGMVQQLRNGDITVKKRRIDGPKVEEKLSLPPLPPPQPPIDSSFGPPFTPPFDPSFDSLLLQVPQVIPLLQQIPSHSSPAASDYNWDERGPRQGQPLIIDGMATTEENGYLGPPSSAAVINLVGGGFFFHDPPRHREGDTNGDGVSPASAGPRHIPKHKLEHYIDQYFHTYHISYPIVHKPLFMAQVNDIVPRPSGCWDSLLYVVAAIGSFMSATSPDEDDDLVLFDMAKSRLSIDVLESGNVTLVQTLTLMSNYLQKRDRPNSGYNYLGLAVRMALGLGLHKHMDDTNMTLLDLEIRRRVWWCLYIFDCGQTITYGRPLSIPCAGIDADLPGNIMDSNLTATTTTPPAQEHQPTIYTSVRLQSLFHIITNSIYERILSDPFPSAKALLLWDRQYLDRWKEMIPSYFGPEARVEPSFQLAHRVLEWRARNFKIIMYRTFLLKRVVYLKMGEMDDNEIKAGGICLEECSQTLSSMARFWDERTYPNRMDAWYSLFFLIPAVLMPLVCLRNDPMAVDSAAWRQDIANAQRVIVNVVQICPSAGRILDLIDNLGGAYLEPQEVNQDGGTDESPMNQLMQLHSMLWPVSFDIEQQFLQ